MARCMSPLSIPHPHGTKKSVRLTVPCGVCVNCIQSKRSDWTLRLMKELENSDTGYFVTLTYNDENLVYMGSSNEPTLVVKDVQGYIKRLRSRVDDLYKLQVDRSSKDIKRPQIRYYFVGEYGPNTKRPHYHGLIFNVPKYAYDCIILSWNDEKKERGFINIGEVNQASIHYCSKYMLDKLFEANSPGDCNQKIEVNSPGDCNQKKGSFTLMSRKPGIGECYVSENKKYHRDYNHNYYQHPGGIKQRLPRFYKDKIFNEKEKEAHARENEKIQDEKDLEGIKERISKGLSEKYVIDQNERKKQNIVKKLRQNKL